MKNKDMNIPVPEEDLNGRTTSFQGHHNVRNSELVLEYTEEELKYIVKEIKKCKKNIHYFAEKYFHIIDPDKGLVKIPLRNYQKKTLKNFLKHRNNLLVQSRQSGKCVAGSTKITIRNKKTGKIQEIEIEKLYNKIKGDE